MQSLAPLNFHLILDRAARLRGFEADLNLTGSQFATVLSVLYVGYLIMQVPSCVFHYQTRKICGSLFSSNMFLAYCGRPSVYLPVCMIIWGIVSTATGEIAQKVRPVQLLKIS